MTTWNVSTHQIASERALLTRSPTALQLYLSICLFMAKPDQQNKDKHNYANKGFRNLTCNDVTYYVNNAKEAVNLQMSTHVPPFLHFVKHVYAQYMNSEQLPSW